MPSREGVHPECGRAPWTLRSRGQLGAQSRRSSRAERDPLWNWHGTELPRHRASLRGLGIDKAVVCALQLTQNLGRCSAHGRLLCPGRRAGSGRSPLSRDAPARTASAPDTPDSASWNSQHLLMDGGGSAPGFY